MSVNRSTRTEGKVEISFSVFFNMKVYCVFLLESPHRGDPDENTNYTVFNIKKKITLNYPKSAAMGFFPGTQERVRNSRGKRAISIQAIEVLLYFEGDVIIIRTTVAKIFKGANDIFP